MSFPLYASAEQIMRDRSDLARKGIGRGRSVVVLTYADGVLFVAENPSLALHKVSEIYDRIGFAAVGKYNEFENLRRSGIQFADLRGYSNDRRDVSGRSLANSYAQILGTIFTGQPKPYEVEIAVAEVGHPDEIAAGLRPQLYRVSFDGSIGDEADYLVMGGVTEPILGALRAHYRPEMDLREGIAVAIGALQQTENGAAPRVLGLAQLEVAVLDHHRPRRAFRRYSGAALKELLPAKVSPATAETAAEEPPA